MQTVTMRSARLLSSKRGSGLVVVHAVPKPQINTPAAPAPKPVVATKPAPKPGSQAAAAPKPSAAAKSPMSGKASLSKEQQDQVWAELVKGMQTGEQVDARIQGTNEKGAIVLAKGLRGFIPYTKLDPARLRAGPVGDVSFLVGQVVRAKVITAEVKEGKRQLVLSERKAQQADALAKISVGAVLKGAVTSIEDYGAFVAIEGLNEVSGLVYKDEVSWSKIITVDSALKIGQQVTVKVVAVDSANVRLSLSIKQMMPDPLNTSMDDSEWGPCVHPEPTQVSTLITKLTNTPGVTSVSPTRQLFDPAHVAQELEVYLSKQGGVGAADGVHTLIARTGSLSTELELFGTLSRAEVKTLIQQLVR